MQVYAHPQLPGTHVVINVRECPRTFRMLSDLTCGSHALEYNEILGGFVMTLDVYQTLRTKLSTANSLLDLLNILPLRNTNPRKGEYTGPQKEPPEGSTPSSVQTRSIQTQTISTETSHVTQSIGTQTEKEKEEEKEKERKEREGKEDVILFQGTEEPISLSTKDVLAFANLQAPASSIPKGAEMVPETFIRPMQRPPPIKTARTESVDASTKNSRDRGETNVQPEMAPSANVPDWREWNNEEDPVFVQKTDSVQQPTENGMQQQNGFQELPIHSSLGESHQPRILPVQRTFQEMANDDAASGISDFHWIHLRRLQIMDILSDL